MSSADSPLPATTCTFVAHGQQHILQNGLLRIVRSHQMVKGYKEICSGLLVTIWAAPK
jgi:hypothetical protein